MKAIMIRSGKVLLDNQGHLPDASMLPDMPVRGEQFSFSDNDVQYVATLVATDTDTPDGFLWVDIRSSFTTLGEHSWMMLTKGVELLNWAESSRFCSRCGAPMQRASEISMRCSRCNNEIWPQLSPCIMVLVRRGDEALLVHAASFSRPFFALIAGFVETGETLEQCVQREVAEETGLSITNIQYFGSQSWPYPAQLMIGFTADYLSGTIKFVDGELIDGGFFSPHNLPMLPSHPSLARQLIDHWLDSK